MHSGLDITVGHNAHVPRMLVATFKAYNIAISINMLEVETTVIDG